MVQTTAAGGDAAGDNAPGDSAAGDDPCEALALAELAATHLLDEPGPAEEHLRRALAIGAATLPAEYLARLGSQLVMVISGQAGRELELADVALRAAAAWDGISEADATHLTLVAARALHRAGRHEQAATLFDQPLAAGAAPYPDTEMAVLRAQYGKSLKLLGRHRGAAAQFLEAARLVRDIPGRAEFRAELAWSAASALDTCGEDDRARAAYRHAADLWGELDRVGPRFRCLRAAAWLQHCAEPADADHPRGLTAMYELLAELEALDPTPEVAVELTHTRRQLADMEARD
ncbi:hypothetical protein [Nocardia sp. NPDC005366]|uniref:hypothetical protein n=1 Tax=Nocardia sp. NPDC005366 TaxID=3156878 RepID=UPI0033BF2F8F